MPKTNKAPLSPEEIRNRLKLTHYQLINILKDKHPHVYNYIRDKGVEAKYLRDKSAGLIGTGVITGSLILSSPLQQLNLSAEDLIAKVKNEQKEKIDLNSKILVNGLKSFLPKSVKPLNANEEKLAESIIKEVTGISAKAELEGEKLNSSYGLIGAEQHLRRFPGDSLHLHKENLREGIAPGLGAWGYFAASRDNLSNELEETEKWYAVVQTLYLPDWEKRLNYLRDWYKYRKVLIVNVENGNAVVAAIADSGPAAWTGKIFGGSPEVMEYLGGAKYKKGKVILLFVDDPDGNVPLGPIKY